MTEYSSNVSLSGQEISLSWLPFWSLPVKQFKYNIHGLRQMVEQMFKMASPFYY